MRTDRKLIHTASAALALAAASAIAQAEERMLFIGNSFTNQGQVPSMVCNLAIDAGWQTPSVQMLASTGQSLAFHRTNTTTLNAVDITTGESAWNHVVLQDLSARPTDAVGLAEADPAGFRNDATWFYDRVKATSPSAQVVLYQTWARHEDHSYYPTHFANRTEMQSQVSFYYRDAAANHIPNHATAAIKTDAIVAPVGEAWQKNYVDGGMRLHNPDEYHANDQGEYLNALVIYGTIFGRSTVGLTPLNGVSSADARTLQVLADSITGKTVPGAAAGTVKPRGVTNASFESSVAADGATLFANNYGIADGWIITGARTNGAGTRNPKTDFPNASVSGGVDRPLAGPADGLQCLMLNSGMAMQRLTDTLEPNKTYKLDVAVGRRILSGEVDATYYIRLYSGDSTLLGEMVGDTFDLTEGSFIDQTIQFTSGAAVTPDQNLRIELGIASTTGAETDLNGLVFDNVRLSVTPVPEPASLGLLALVGGLAMTRRVRSARSQEAHQ